MSKLTLSVDKGVVLNAKRYSKQQGVSLSRMVEAYPAAVASPPARVRRDTPVLRALRGSLKKAEVRDYRRHLAAKYR